VCSREGPASHAKRQSTDDAVGSDRGLVALGAALASVATGGGEVKRIMNISTPTGRMAEVPLAALAGEPVAIAHILAAYQAVDIAEALNRLDRPDAARILAAMPSLAAVQVFNLRDLVGAAELLELMPLDYAPAILSGLHSDRRVGIFRQLSEVGRDRLKPRLPEATREAP
jgi:hypothetical protein